MEVEVEAFGRVVRQMRDERGLSQEDLGFTSGLDRSYISFLETGKHRPTIVTVFRLANGFGVPASEMIRRVEQVLME